MAINIVQIATGTGTSTPSGTNTATFTAEFTNPVTTGNSILLLAAGNAGFESWVLNVGSVSDTEGNNYGTAIRNDDNHGGFVFVQPTMLAIYYIPSCVGGSSFTVSVVWNQEAGIGPEANSYSIVALELSGAGPLSSIFSEGGGNLTGGAEHQETATVTLSSFAALTVGYAIPASTPGVAWAALDLYAPGVGDFLITFVSCGNYIPSAPTATGYTFVSQESYAGDVAMYLWTLAVPFTTPTPSGVTTLHSWQPSFVPKPETIQDRFGDWYDFGQASYIRGVIIRADTMAQNKNISIRNSDTGALVEFYNAGGFSGVINHNGEQEIAYYFQPFVSHMVRDEPQDLVPWRKFGEFEWIRDPWPELIALPSAWMDLGFVGAKYLRGAVIPMDTNGQSVSLSFVSSDGGNRTMGPFNTTAAVKTSVGISFQVPLIGHEFQLVPGSPVRVWYDQIRWIFDQWPELTGQTSPWMNVGQ